MVTETVEVPGETVVVEKEVVKVVKEVVVEKELVPAPIQDAGMEVKDNLHYTIILEQAVRRAAFRTAKVDKLTRVAVVDRAEVEATSPDLNYRTLAAADSFNYFMPMNKPPFDDLRVRIAMNNAVDRDVYTNTLLGGESILLAHPLTPEWPLHFEPLEDMPQMVQDYFKYDPEKAEALLDEAGLQRGADGVRFEVDIKWDEVLAATDSGEQVRLIREAARLWLELAPAVQVPAFFEADYWQPWVLNHNGERYLKFADNSTHWAYAWIDRDARAERTGFRD